MSSVQPGQQLGAYEIVAALRGGGMASLYLGRRVGPEGFSRLVAIKVVHDHLASDRAFVEMFLDEARLSSRIVHPNVVRVEELGEHDGCFFLAMEFVHGATLSALMSALSRASRTLPPAIACAIAMRTLDGLHAAHEVTDDQGVSLEVIHRDVSPQNILLSDAGHVKLIDFGVAKARGRKQASEAGALKGKLGYMSPEQAWGRSIDRRADLYALGVVLWEMLTRERLLTGDSEIAVLEAARAPQVQPPHVVDPTIPEAISTAVMTALAPDPADRFQTAHAFRRALGNACPQAVAVEPEHIAALLRAVLGAELERERELLRSEPQRSLAHGPVSSVREASTQVSRPSRAGIDPPFEGPAVDGTPRASSPSVAPMDSSVAGKPTGRRVRALALGAVALLTLGALGGVAAKRAASRARNAQPESARAGVVARGACANKVSLVVPADDTRWVALDTRFSGDGLFALGSLRVSQTPERVVELRVEGTGPRAIDLSTVGSGTDPTYDTVLAVFRGPCSEAMTRRAPDVTGDDQPASQEFRARAALRAQGGDVLTVVVAGFGGVYGARVDRGLVQLDVANRSSRAPALTSGALLAGERALIATVHGGDVDRDAEQLQVRLLGADNRVLSGVAHDGFLSVPFDGPTDELSFEGTARLDVQPEIDLAAAVSADLRLVDRPGNESPSIRIPVVHGAIVGPGARCDGTHACGAELTCDSQGVCRPRVENERACQSAPSVTFSFGDDGVGRASYQGRIPHELGHFSGACFRAATAGHEQIVRLRVPPGRWSLVASTDDESWDGGMRLAPDTILYLRRSCLDSTPASAPIAWCNDDIAFRVNQRSRVSVAEVSGGDLYAFVEMWGSSVADTYGDRYTLSLQLRPLARPPQSPAPH
ncbi:MAG: serine/threonine-protein kinase [Deltaproteobacteria bacterium]|nr:serine/threonine-protein kinase [Deltaproteobacteria bacterium]